MERREKVSKILFFIFVLSFIWSVLQIISPLSLQEDTVQNLTGQTAVVDNKYLTDTLPFPVNGIYAIGDRLCHQIDSRSFFINGNQMPFCSRCTAIFFGITLGLLIISIFKIPLDDRLVLIIILSILPIGVDGIGQLLNFWESNNILRIISGLLIGTTCGIAIGIIIDETRSIIKSKTT